jgi:hypothetical protein
MTAVSSAAGSAVGLPPNGVSVAVFTAAQLIYGVLDPKGQRISDIVNNNTTSFLTLFQAEAQDLLLGTEPGVPLGEMTLRKDLLELVVPQDAQPAFRPQVATRQMALEVSTNHFRIRGGLHRRDSDPSNLVQLMSGYSRHFLPLSDATIEHLWRADVRTTAPIVLVNAQFLSTWAFC